MCSNEELALRHALCALSAMHHDAETNGPELFKCAKCRMHVQLTGENFSHDSTQIGWLPQCWHAVHWRCATDVCAACGKATPALSNEQAPPSTDNRIVTLTQLVRAIGAAPPRALAAPAGMTLSPTPAAQADESASKRAALTEEAGMQSALESLLGLPIVTPSAPAAAPAAAAVGKPSRPFAAKFDSKQKCVVCGNTWKKNDMVCFTGNAKDMAHAGCIQAL